jgi:hypothetical protein
MSPPFSISVEHPDALRLLTRMPIQIVDQCTRTAGAGAGVCSSDDLQSTRPIVSDMCNFFNATQYASYVGCDNGWALNPWMTLNVASRQNIVVTA